MVLAHHVRQAVLTAPPDGQSLCHYGFLPDWDALTLMLALKSLLYVLISCIT